MFFRLPFVLYSFKNPTYVFCQTILCKKTHFIFYFLTFLEPSEKRNSSFRANLAPEARFKLNPDSDPESQCKLNTDPRFKSQPRWGLLRVHPSVPVCPTQRAQFQVNAP